MITAMFILGIVFLTILLFLIGLFVLNETTSFKLEGEIGFPVLLSMTLSGVILSILSIILFGAS